MRRFLAVLLCVALFAGMVPAEALAATLLYEYPSVNAYLAPNNLEALEYEFRQWAAQTLENYLSEGRTAIKRSENLKLPGVQDAYSLIEYYRMAKTKKDFDSDKGKIKENIYNNYEMNESERQGMYLWVFIESVKEKMYANQNLLEQYNKIDEDEKRYWMLDVETGGLKKDDFAQQAQNASNDVAIAKWSKVATNFVTALAETVADYFIITKGSEKTASTFADIVDGLGETLNSIAETVIDANEANALKKIDNAVREELQADLSEAVNNVSDEMLEYLKESYVNTENRTLDRGSFGADYYTDLIKGFVDSVESNRRKYQEDLDAEVSNSMAEETAKQIISDINYEMLATLDAKQIAMMATLNGISTMYKETIDFAFDKLIYETLKEKGMDRFTYEFTLDYGSVPCNVEVKDIIEVLKNAVTEPGKKGIEEYVAGLMEDVNAIPDNIGEEAMKKAWENVKSEENLENVISKLRVILMTGFVTAEMADVISLSDTDEVGKAFLDAFETACQVGTENELKGEKADSKDIEKIMKSLLKLTGKVTEAKYNEAHKNVQNAVKEANNLDGMIKDDLEENGSFSMVTTGTTTPFIKKVEEEKKKVEEKIDELEKIEQPWKDKKHALDIVLKVADKWWDVGCSIRSALESSASASSGEGIMSMLAMRMVTCENMSMGLKSNINLFLINNENNFVRLYALGDAGFKEAIMNPRKTSLEELYSLVSQLYVANQYDIVGSSAYLDMALHEDVFYKDWNWSSAKFAKYIEDNHINNQGQKGMLPFGEAEAEYDKYIRKNIEYEIDDKWRALFN